MQLLPHLLALLLPALPIHRSSGLAPDVPAIARSCGYWSALQETCADQYVGRALLLLSTRFTRGSCQSPLDDLDTHPVLRIV
jgi:hypothetical protein